MLKVYSVITNYCVLQELWDSYLETRLQPDIRSRIIGVQAQMKQFEYFFGISHMLITSQRHCNTKISLLQKLNPLQV